MSRKWPADHTKRLIELYEVQPILYNIKSPQYHNKIARQTCLTTIQGSLEAYTGLHKNKVFSGGYCQKDNGAGADELSKPNWYLYEALQFLIPYVKADQAKSNIVNSEEIEISEERNLSQMNGVDDEIHTSDFLEEIPAELLSPSTSTASTSSSRKRKLNNKSRKRSTEDEFDSLLQEASSALKTIQSSSTSVCSSDSDTDIFMKYAATELKKIRSKSILRKCTRVILQVIQDHQDEDEEV
ncbi:Alcohol dehydrogenase transcription factor Myb/SANT-like [Popillia japonica]|uniref:Alcohol dehydrogenase transcription factor Myb/SANT-like n=1 Tax=Popillia japonica TaxID=7064 RepID=A0AAW1ITP4_POPJA